MNFLDILKKKQINSAAVAAGEDLDQLLGGQPAEVTQDSLDGRART